MAGLGKRRAKMFGTGILVAVAATVVVAAAAGRAGADPLCGFSQVSAGGPTPAGFAATARWSAGVPMTMVNPRLPPVRLRK
jgi:hypothetical protein